MSGRQAEGGCCGEGMWSSRVLQHVADAAEDDSRWSRWFHQSGLLSNGISKTFRLGCATVLLCVWCYEMYYVAFVKDGRENFFEVVIDYAFLTLWGVCFNLVYFLLQALYFIGVLPFSKGCILRWILLFGQFALLTEAIVMVLYFILVFDADYAANHTDPYFWFTLWAEHLFSPFVIMIDSYFNRLPFSKRLLIPLFVVVNIYVFILWYTSTHYAQLYPGIPMDDTYSAIVVIAAEVAVGALGLGVCKLRKSQDTVVADVLNCASRTQQLLPAAR